MTSIYYRLTHMTVKSGIVNGRTVRIQAPVDGTIQDFYGRPGVPVQSGQTLVRLETLAQSSEQAQSSELSQVPPLQRQVQAIATELEIAKEALALLNQQKVRLAQTDRKVQDATVAVAGDDINRFKAALDAAIAEERAAKTDYNRFQALLEQGAVSEQQVDQLEATWKASQANVNEARAQLESGQTVLTAARTNLPLDLPTDDLQERREALAQEIQAQEATIQRTTLALANRKAELAEVKALEKAGEAEVVGDDADLIEVSAPFSGVVYTTRHEAGEQVSRPATLLSLLDCNDLWVEAVIDGDRANHVDASKPVRVQLLGSDQTLVGRVSIIEAISTGELTQARAEAIIPAIPPNLVNQPIARVRVTIPSYETQSRANQFCGLGQNAQLTFSMNPW
ncbi:MAG: HlyD family secretion protein [Elainellaceae cyanobacterium]